MRILRDDAVDRGDMADTRLLKRLLLAAGAILLLAGVALWRFDPPLDAALLASAKLDWTQPFARHVAWFTVLGGFAVLGPVALLVVGWLAARRRSAEALWLFGTIASGRIIVEATKLLAQRPRPPVVDSLEIVTSYSFPSSHSAGTMLTCMAIALLMPRRWPAVTLALLAALAIGWSRIALGVHYPSDVIAGLGFGLLWAATAHMLFAPIRVV